MNNPYPYSNDNKRYQTINYYFRNKYHQKVAKIPLNAGFTCPNRDGTKGIGGCTFCSSMGSGDSILCFDDSLQKQYKEGLKRMQNKWPDCIGFAYFQSYSNTYAPLETLKKVYDPFFKNPDIPGVAIATRADCLSDEIIDYLNSQNKEVWLELGLQSIHEKTMERCNRKHSTQIVFDWLDKLKSTNIKTCVHIINGLPNETKSDMLETVKQISKHPIDAIKIHMLHLIEGTQMAKEYKEHPFHILTLEEYVDIVVDQLELLPQEIIIDPSHAAGDYKLIESLSLAAIAAGADGLIIEVHDDPENAWSDGAQSLKPKRYAKLVKKGKAIAKVVGREL